MHIVFYASAHGMGHQVRLAEIGRALLELNPECRLSYRGRVERSLLSARIGRAFDEEAPEFDVGLVETDLFTQDLEETARRGERLLKQWEPLRSAETRFLRKEEAGAVVCDLPGIPLEAASDAGIPGIAVGNFSWDWVYGVYDENSNLPVFGDMTYRFRRAYAKASFLARIPVGPSMNAFGRTLNVGLVGRKGNEQTFARLREKYHLRTPSVFLAIQKTARPEMLARGIARTPGQHFFGFLDLKAEPPAYTRIEDEDQTFFPELVWMADVVMTTLGHSILSECVANGTPIVTPPRVNYPEYDVLLSQGSCVHPIVEIPLEEFRKGRWAHAIERVKTVIPPEPPPSTDGAREIAELILREVKRR